jgi:hypothetical protein
MSFAFTPQQGLILVLAKATGPHGDLILHLALDTGATTTLINEMLVQSLGYDTVNAPKKVQIATASGAEMAAQVTLLELCALGFDRANFPVVCLPCRPPLV